MTPSAPSTPGPPKVARDRRTRVAELAAGRPERSLLRSTLRALLVPQRLVPIALLGAVLVVAQWRFSLDPGATPLGLLMCLAFVLVAPVSWRALFPPTLDARPTFAAPFGRLIVYGITGVGTVLLVGWALPQRLGIGPTFMTSDVSLLVSLALFWVGGYGLGRHIDLESSLAIERARVAELAAEAERAQLLALRSHLDPHFLFNTLNAIAEWCREDGEVAEQATLRLSQMLRTVLVATREPAWPLRRELDLAQTLLDLHRIRDPERFTLECSSLDEAPAVKVPPMILLPLVENAAKHGPNAGHRGAIALRVRVDPHVGDGRLRLEVENPGPFGGEREGGEGLSQVRRRLAHAYGGSASLTVQARGDRTLACIALPLDVEVPHANA
ncbi:MAG: histidine kinase [Myxococcota bacterium]